MPTPDLTTKRFGKLTVIQPTAERMYGGSIGWICLCDCGKLHRATTYRLQKGRVSSCGCDFSEKQREDLTGRRFGFLTCVRPTGRSRGQAQHAEWECICDCGGFHTTTAQVLKHQRNIGCLKCRSTRIRDANTTHGMARRAEYSAEYNAWQAMIQRCTNPTNPRYTDYGGRGITVCEQWRGPAGFPNFFQHVGPRPDSKMSLSRTDNEKGYYPDNVKWDTKRNQQLNRRITRFLTIDGVIKPMLEWSEESGTKWQTIDARLRGGWDPKDAVFQPLRKGKKLTNKQSDSIFHKSEGRLVVA